MNMKKWGFWAAMCGVSILNGLLFFAGSYNDMQRGLEGVDNQAALLFIPLLWILAAITLLALNGFAFVHGRGLDPALRVRFFHVFHFAGLRKGAAAARVSFFVFDILLMGLGCQIFTNRLCNALYALTGGVYLLFLYVWTHAEDLQENAA